MRRFSPGCLQCYRTGLLILGSFICLARAAYAQVRISKSEFVSEAKRYLSVIKSGSDKYDSIMSANTSLFTWLTQQANSQPQLMQQDLSELDTVGMQVLTSADKKFRTFSWDSHTGGKIRNYLTLAQFITPDGRSHAKDLSDSSAYSAIPDPGALHYNMFSIKTRSGKTFYMPLFLARYSDRSRLAGIHAYTITADSLSGSTAFFFSPTQSASEISYEYDFFAGRGVNSANKEIHFSSDMRILYIPVVDNQMAITSKFLQYWFDGERYVYRHEAKKPQKHK